MSEERRTSPRLPASLAGEIETTEGTSSIAISRDVAAGGLLVFARRTIDIGTHVKLIVVFQGEQLKLEGDVLRCEELELGSSTLWRTQVAIGVAPNDPVLSRIFAALAAAPAESD